MSDLIGREQAIEAVYQALRKPSNDEVFIRIRSALKEIPTASCWIPFEGLPPNDDWIPCSERLPEPLQEVIVTSTQGHVYTSRIAHGNFEYGGDVVAWMSLPEPYKGGE